MPTNSKLIATIFTAALLLSGVGHAGVQLDRANSEYLTSTNSSLILSTPFLVLAWAKCTSCTSGQRAVVTMGSSGDNANGHTLIMDGDDGTGDKIAVRSRQGSGTEVEAVTTTGYTGSTWHAVAGYWVSATDRRVYIDGGSKGTNTTNVTPNAMDTYYVGRRGTTNYMNGTIAEMALYDCTGASAASVETDIASAAAGDNPLTLTACTLVEYWPLDTNGNGYCSGINLSSNGTITYSGADHPTVDAPVCCPGECATPGGFAWPLLRTR